MTGQVAILLSLLQAAPHAAPPRVAPTLVVVITVDQCRADYLQRWRPQLSGGLARLLRGGAVFSNAFQDHAMTETAPGHATVLSGRNPHSTGIVRNDEGVPDTSASGRLVEVAGPGASPWRFRGTELFDWIAARYPGARALSVSRKDRGAILPIGRARQQVYWFARGKFTTSHYYEDSLPVWVREFDAGAPAAYAPGRVWDLLRPARDYAEPDSEPYENGGHRAMFPYALPDDSAAAAAAFVAMPFMDSLTLAFALRGVNELELGKGPGPDLLAVSLSTTDAIGHAFGPGSREIHDQVLRLDRYLGAFLDSLARLRDQRRILVALTADHGVTPFPAWSRGHGFPGARRVRYDSVLTATQDALAARAGPGQWILWVDVGVVALDRPGLAELDVNVDSAVAALAAMWRRVPGVLRVDTRRTLAKADTARDAIARRWRYFLPPDSPIELMVTLQPKDVWAGSRSAEHGQPSDDDTHVPLVIAGPGIRPGRYGRRVQVADLAPTLAYLLGAPPLERLDGRVLREAVR